MSDKTVVGKIRSVACKDFVTYKEVVFYPDEYLNLIIGPNGTGKSTLVAAIVLGLGGAPKTLSRSTDINDYIKNGKTRAWIEIQIYKDISKNLIKFEREIEASNKKSTYRVDGNVVSAKVYLAEISEYNIQISNLCQFLPQDRVQDFAKMNAKEILVSTLSSVCSPETLEQFEKLKELQDTTANSNSSIHETTTKLKEAEILNKNLQQQIDRMNARKDLQNDISVSQIKQNWLKYKEMKLKLTEVQNELNEAKLIWKHNEDNFNKIKEKSLDIIKKSFDYKNQLKVEVDNMKKFSEKLSEFNNQCEEFESNIRSAKNDFERKQIEINEKDAEVSNEKKVLEGLCQDLKDSIADTGDEADCKIKLQHIEAKLDELKTKHEILMKERIRINRVLDDEFTPQLQALKNKKNTLKNVNEQKLNWLRDRQEDVYRGVMWLRTNRHLFQGRIYEPMLLEVSIINPAYAKYLENSVSIRDFLAFTCENKSDVDLLIRHLCNEQNLRINVLHSDPAENCVFTPKENVKKFSNLGFVSYMLDTVQAPAPILNYLCQAHAIHKILIGTEKVSSNIDMIPKHITCFFAGDHKYTITFSKYTGDSSTMKSEIYSKKLLSAGPDKRQLELLESEFQKITINSDQLKNERTDIERKLTMIQEKRNNFAEEKAKIVQKQRTVDQQKFQVKRQIQKINDLEKNIIDIGAEKEKFMKLSMKIVKSIFLKQIEKIECLSLYQKAIEKHDIIYVKKNIFIRENAAVEREVANAKEAYRNSQSLVETIQKSHDTKEERANAILSKLKSDCDGKDPTNRGFPLKEAFSNLPNNIDELSDIILEKQAKVNCMMANDQKIIDEYEKRKKEIKQLMQKIESFGSHQRSLTNEIENLHNIWYPCIKRVVDTINSTFSQLMSSMSYIGSVELSKTTERDYNNYGIQISVQYRNNAALQVLDRFVQSGGERAVAIAVYTLSLQRITHVPFRCVDEINQGMDERNERKFFEMLVNETAKPKQSQYFFVTPKLLPNLCHNAFMTVHIVYNGIIDDYNIFNVQ